MDMESLYDYVEEDQDFYDETPATRKGGYPIDHRSIKVSRALTHNKYEKFKICVWCILFCFKTNIFDPQQMLLRNRFLCNAIFFSQISTIIFYNNL